MREKGENDKNDDDNKGENRKTAKTKCNTEKIHSCPLSRNAQRLL